MSNDKKIMLGLSALSMGLIVLSFTVGRYALGFGAFFSALADGIRGVASPEAAILFHIRLPRILAAFLIGASLCASGSAYQGMFRNPLVSPDILGVAHGAGFGASLAIFFRLAYPIVQLMAFAGGILAVLLSIAVSNRVPMQKKVSLVLVGTMLGTLFFSLIALLKFFSNPSDTLQAITFWLMGSLTKVTMPSLLTCLLPMTVGMILLFSVRTQLNLLTLEDEEAQSMGLPVKRTRMIVMLGATLLTASAVTLGGLIGFVGLILPHMARRMVGADFRKLLPVCMLLGGCFLLAMDDLARSLLLIELPIGVLCAVLGAPAFIWMLCGDRTAREGD